ncbi:MAG: cytochrome c [Burkholderiales bacterium]|nr:cytochrome c [Burkholderiales bacterium]MDE2276916.1 cytochrome c [Burkholderiales bacterium]
MKPFAALALLVTLAPVLAAAQDAASLFKGADLALGEKLFREYKCAECHSRQVGGDGSAIFRPHGRINTPAALLAQVGRCSQSLNLKLSPEALISIAAALNRDHYHFN